MRALGVSAAAAVLVVALAAPGAAVPPGRDGRIAFQRDGEAGSTDIWVMNGDGTAARNVTPDAANDFEPSWSPDGRQIAFVSDRGGEFLSPPALFVMSADGEGIRRLATGASSPAWSPDARLIAFSACVARDELDVCRAARIAVVSPKTRRVRHLTRTAGSVVDSEPAWSPDGRRIVFARTIDNGFNVLWTIGVDGKGLRRLVDDRSQLEHGPSWSPDGKQIVYVSDASDADAVWTVQATGRGRRVVFTETGDPTDEDAAAEGVGNPVFSPSGVRILFTRGGDLWSMSRAGRDLRQLTEGGADEADWARAR